MGLFGKLFKGPEIDMEKSAANARRMRELFNDAVENGDDYRLIYGYTEDVSRFNYGFVHGSKTKIGSLIVGWNEAAETIIVVPTVPDLSGRGEQAMVDLQMFAEGGEGTSAPALSHAQAQQAIASGTMRADEGSGETPEVPAQTAPEKPEEPPAPQERPAPVSYTHLTLPTT